MSKRPTVVLSCSVLSDLLGKRLPEGMPVTWMDITLHNTPKKLAAALQERIDAIAELVKAAFLRLDAVELARRSEGVPVRGFRA